MSLDGDLSRFIGRIYESVYDADAWQPIVTEVMRLTGSRIAFLASVDLQNAEFNRTFFYGPEESCVDRGTQEYSEETYSFDPSLEWSSRHPNAGMCETQMVIPQCDYHDHPFIKWNRSRFGTTHWRVFYTPPKDGLSFALSLHPPAEVGAPPAELRPLHHMLFCHIERAIRLAARPPDFSRDSGAIIALDSRGKIVAMSSRAEQLLTLDDGLKAEELELFASSPASASALGGAIYSAIDAHVHGGAGGGVRIERPSGKPDWLAIASPYPRFLEHLPIPVPAAVIRILENEIHASLRPEHAQLFDLTPREMQIASALLEGHSLDSLAAKFEISRNTARVHLQSLFRKTGANRQTDLVRILSTISQN